MCYLRCVISTPTGRESFIPKIRIGTVVGLSGESLGERNPDSEVGVLLL